MIEEHIKKSIISAINSGAIIRFDEKEGLEFVVGLGSWVGEDLYWCQWFPEDQHHTHFFRVDAVKMHHDLCFEFFGESGHGWLTVIEPYDERNVNDWKRWVEVRDMYLDIMPKNSF